MEKTVMPDEHLSGGLVKLPAVIDLSNVSALKAMLVDQLNSLDPLAIDCTAVTRITTPAVQVLLSFAKTTAEEGRPPVLHNPSEAFRCAFSELGLQDQLTQWSAS